MANDLNIRIKINSDTKALEVTQDGFEKIRKKAGEAGEPIDKLSSGMSNLADNVKSVAAAYASLSVIDKFIRAGFEYNKTMEQQIAGMQRAIVATSQDVSAKGKQLTLMEKYAYAAREAHTAVADLEKINAQTPHTLTQTIQIYNAMYASMKRNGASNEEMIRTTKEISMATSNLDFNSVLAGVDGLATGTVEVSSDFGRFIATLGLTNEALKKTDNVAKLVHEKLGQMTLSANTMDEATSNMTNAWEKFAGKATEPLFEVIKDDIKDVTKAMEDNNQALLDFVYFLSLPVAGAHLLVNAFRVSFNTIPLYFEDAGLAIKEYWIKLLYEIQKSARDVLPERMAGLLGFDSKSIKDNKNALAQISKDRSALAQQVAKEQELLFKTADAYYNINVPKKAQTSKNNDSLLANPTGQTEEEKKAAEKAAKEARKQAEKLVADINKAKLDAAEYNAEQEAALALSVYQAELDAAQFNIDQITQMHIDAYNAQEQAAIDSYERQAQAALRIFETSQSEVDKINADYLSVWESAGEFFDDTQMNEFFKKWQESIDGVKGGYNDISSMVDNLKLGDDFSESFTGIAKSIANASKAIKNFSNIAEDAAEAKKAITSSKNLTEEQKAIQLKKLENKEMQAQIGAYANLAGAASMFYEEGSKGAKTLAIAQSGLAMVSAVTGIAEQSKLPFPANIGAMLTTAGTVFGFLSQAGIMGGGGGGYTTPQSITDVQTKQEAYKSETEEITSRLDRSNELLKIIGKNGSAAQVDVLSKKIAYDRTLGNLSYTVAQDVVEAVRTEQFRKDAIAQLVAGGSAAAGVSIGSVSARGSHLDTTVLAGNIEASVRYINYLSENIDNINFDAIDRFERADVTAWVDDILEAVSEFSTGLIDNINALKDASGEFQDTFDSLTGTTTYSMQRLQKAYAEVNSLVGDSTLPEYLSRQIENIEKLNLSQKDIQTLLIQDTSALIDQEQILSRISGELGVAFEGGAKDALDYLESINLVADAMITSRENTINFLDSLRTDEELALGMASVAGVSLATNVDQLSELFWKLGNDMDRLTDADLELLNANKSLIEAQKESSTVTSKLEAQQTSLNDYISSVSQNISTLQSALGNIGSTIDKLRESAYGPTYTMSKYREAMALALSLRDSTDYSGFATAIKNAVNASAVLTSGNTGLEGNQLRWEQAVAANQLKDLEKNATTQIDYLKMIEENTRAQVEILSASINNLADTIDSELIKSIQERDPNTGFIASKYQEVLGRAGDEAGIAYWANQIAGGAVTQSRLGIAIGAAGVANEEMSRAQYVAMLYNKGLGRAGTDAEIDYWANKSSTPTTALASTFAQLEPNFHAFAEGGLIKGGKGGVLGLIGEKEHDELILPLKDDPIGIGVLIAELRGLRKENEKLREDMKKVLEKIEANTQKSRSAA